MSNTKKPNLHRDWIDNRALEIVKSLQKGGHETYLVGGCVRDLLIGVRPKDYDIATSARPQEVKKLVPNSYIIGKRFRLVLAKRGKEQFEIATFRRDASDEERENEDLPPGDNVFGTPQEDAKRRDFTINALFYDPVTDEVVDYNTGLDDIKSRKLKMIGDPVERLKEDPIRILRALRLSHKLHLSIEPELRKAITECADALPESVLPRRREELLKILRLHQPGLALQEAHDLGVLKSIWPTLESLFDDHHVANEVTHFMNHLNEGWFDKNDPVQPFAFLVYSYLTFYKHLKLSERIPYGELSNDATLLEFMKSELGMFMAECSITTQSIELIPRLKEVEAFDRRSPKRKTTFVSQNGFSLALTLAKIDHLISAPEFEYWMKHLK